MRGAPLEARLQHPDLAHVDRELAAPRDVADARVERRVDRCLQRREGRLAGFLALAPAVLHVVPEHRGEHEARRHGLACGDARVGVGERKADELLAPVVTLRLVERDVEDREDAAVQAQLLQLDDRRQAHGRSAAA